MYICICYQISEEVLQEHIEKGCSKEELIKKLHCTTSCGSCEGTIEYMIQEHNND